MDLGLGAGRAHFYQSLASSAKAGLPLIKSLGILADGSASVPPQTLRDVAKAVERGKTMSSAMKAHADDFPAWEAEMVAVGEATGRLDDVFLQIAEMLEQRRAFALALLSGFAYPLFLMHAAPFILFAKTAYFQGAGPYLLEVAQAFLWIYVPIAALAALVRSGVLTRRNLPLGGLISKLQFCRFLAAMLRAAVPFARALEMAASAAGVPAPESQTVSGETMLRALSRYELFSPDELAALEVGEQTGTIDEKLQYLSQRASESLNASLKVLSTVLPVVLYLGIAGFFAYKTITGYQQSMDGLFKSLDQAQ